MKRNYDATKNKQRTEKRNCASARHSREQINEKLLVDQLHGEIILTIETMQGSEHQSARQISLPVCQMDLLDNQIYPMSESDGFDESAPAP